MYTRRAARALGRRPIPPRALARRLGGSFAVAAAVLVVGYGFQPQELARGVAEQLALVSSGREPSFLNGEVSHEGWWYYYLYALLMKLPVPMLLLLLARTLLPRAGAEAGRRDAAFLLTPPAVFLTSFSLAGSVNNGLRYVLPILPFLFVWVGGLAQARAWRRPGARAPLAAALGALLAWYAAASAAIHPHPLAYFNELVGGPRNGHRHLLDSNLDWGQDLPGLARYQAEHGLGPIKLCYFGSADPGQHGVAYQPLPGCTGGPGRLPAHEIAPGDLVAISATHLYPLFVDLGPVARHFRRQEPLATIGHSIRVYRAEVALQLPPAR